MDEARMALVVEAEGLHDEPDISKHLELAARVLEQALTSEETLANADNHATATATAKGEIAKAEARLDRAKFRAWMRVQAAAEQGQRFKPTPTARSVHTNGG